MWKGCCTEGCCTEGDADACWISPQLLTKTSTHTVHAAGFGGDLWLCVRPTDSSAGSTRVPGKPG